LKIKLSDIRCGHSVQGSEARNFLAKATSFGYDGIIGLQNNGILQ